MWTGRQAEVGLRKSPVARDFRDDTSPTHRFAINGAPTLRDEWGTQALPSFGYDLVGGEIHLHDQNGVHVLMGEDRYSELATKGKV